MLFLCNMPALIIQSFSGICLLLSKLTQKIRNLVLWALQIKKGVCIKTRFIKLWIRVKRFYFCTVCALIAHIQSSELR